MKTRKPTKRRRNPVEQASTPVVTQPSSPSFDPALIVGSFIAVGALAGLGYYLVKRGTPQSPQVNASPPAVAAISASTNATQTPSPQPVIVPAIAPSPTVAGDSMGRVIQEVNEGLSPARIDWAKRILSVLGYATQPDGTVNPSFLLGAPIGSDMRMAINAFQGAYGRDAANHLDWQPRLLYADGVLDRLTLSAMSNYIPYAASRGVFLTALPS